jgi:hypothetical protein
LWNRDSDGQFGVIFNLAAFVSGKKKAQGISFLLIIHAGTFY